MRSLNEKVVVVTGGARGMGAEYARRLVSDGARVVIGDILDAPGEALAAELGDAAMFCHLDVRFADSWSRLLEATHERFGPVTSLVNNAGINVNARLHETSDSDFDWTFEVNLKGSFSGMKAVLPDMIQAGSGAIINIGAPGAFTGYETLSAYQSSKSALIGLTKSAAIEYGKHGIRVNTVHPGICLTSILSDAMERTEGLKEVVEGRVKTHAIPRYGELAEVASVISFLLSDEASFITGVDLPVDGGMLLGKASALA